MAWVKVDDGFPDHPKVLVLTLAAQGLWLAGLCYANRHRTDGQLPSGFLRRVGDDSAWTAAEELVAVGLWHETAAGWEIHDYADYQSTKEQIEAVAAKRAEAGKRGGQANAKQTRSNLLGVGLAFASTRQSKTEAEEEVEEEEEQEALRAGNARARSANQPAAARKRTPATTKLTSEFEPSESTLAWAREHGWQAEAFQREFEKFTGYHLAKGGRMASWDQALINWLRKAEEFAAQKVVPIRAGPANGRPSYEDFTAVLDDIIAGGGAT